MFLLREKATFLIGTGFRSYCKQFNFSFLILMCKWYGGNHAIVEREKGNNADHILNVNTSLAKLFSILHKLIFSFVAQ